MTTLACALLLAASSATPAPDQDQQHVVDARGLAFASLSAFCRYHCKPTHARRAYRHLREDSECTTARCGSVFTITTTAAESTRRRLVEEEAGVAEQQARPSSDRRRAQAVDEDDGESVAASQERETTGSSLANIETTTQSPSYNFASSDLTDRDASRAGNAEAHAAAEAEDKEVQTVDFVTCQGVADTSSASGARVALSVGDATKSAFAGFYEAFFKAYDAMISSSDAKYDACQLQFFQQGFLSNLTQSNKFSDPLKVKPMLVKLNGSSFSDDDDATMTEIQCVDAVKDIWGPAQETFTPFLTRSDQVDANSTILLVHVNATVADRIVNLQCVESVTSLPSILKLTPFARSMYSYALNPSTTEGPALEIRLVKGSDYSAALARLSDTISSVTGIKNALAARGDETNARVLTLTALEEFETWTHIVAIVVDDEAVEWVDLKQTITTGALQPNSSLEQKLLDLNSVKRGLLRTRGSSHRRLDTYIQDLVGVKEMQDHNITGAGIVVGVTDTGLYIDHDQFDQTSRAMFNQLDKTARKVVLYRAFANKGDESENVLCGHGTHVSGILAGNSLSKKAANLGIAYDAKIAFMDIGKQVASCAGQRGCEVTLETPGEVEELMNQQVKAGARIFSFSWGTGGNDYNTQSRDLDNYIYNNPETLIIVAAGNSGDKGSHTISSPSGAKNVLSIGASLNDAASFALTPCPTVLNKQTIASFSSIGPTLDGRQKPDIVAPGMAVDSSQSEAPGSTLKSTAICSLQGTSQATPVVAGMAVLLYEWLRDGWWKNGVKDAQFGMTSIPASLLKALLIHSGEKLSRRLVAPKNGITSCVAMEAQAIALTSYPDMNQGYGKPTMLNLASFAQNGTGGSGVYFYPNSSANSEPRVVQGGEAVFSFVLKQRANLRVTLVWSDPAGSMGGKIALQNDLDLSVRLPGSDKVFYPLSGNGTKDSINNVEMVEVTYDQIAEAAKQAGMKVTIETGVTVEAVVAGYSVKAGSQVGQAFALVASSSPSVVETKATSSAEIEFWQPWMTIGAVIVGTLAVLFLIALVWRVHSARAAMSNKPSPSRSRPVNTHANYRNAGQQRPPQQQVNNARPVLGDRTV